MSAAIAYFFQQYPLASFKPALHTTMVQDFIFCLQEATSKFIFKESWQPQQPSECFVNPPCGCTNPGRNLQCEDCIYLEACLSNFKPSKSA